MLKLRYHLLWAGARSSRRGMLFFGLFVLFLVYMVVASANSGMALALFAQQRGNASLMVKFCLTLIYFGGISASITLGRGPHQAFSERNLRHYPLTSFQRLLVRHLTGLLDPVWFCCLAIGLGLVAGLVLTKHFLLAPGLAAVLALVIAGYLTSALLLTVAERILSTMAGTALFSALVLVFLSAMSSLLTHQKGAAIFDSRYFALTPPGLATNMVLSGESFLLMRSFFLLLLACGTLWVLLTLSERLQSRHSWSKSRSAHEVIPAWRFGVNQESGFALIKRSLLYHLRCNRVRFGVAVTIPVLFFYNQWMGNKQGAAGATFGSVAAFFLIGLCATRSMTLNQFGYDGPGFKRYLFSPVSLEKVLFCNRLVSVLLGWTLIIPTLIVFKLGGAISFDVRWIFILICSAIAGGFFFNACGIWTSILSPRFVVFNKITGNDMTVAGNLVVFAGFLACFGTAYWLAGHIPFSFLLDHWFYGVAAVLLAAALYAGSIVLAGPFLQQRRTKLMGIVTATGAA